MSRSKKKKIQNYKKISGKKIPKNTKDPDSYLSKSPVWAFKRCDLNSNKWNICKCNDFYTIIMDKLASFEGLTWAQIMGTSGGRTYGTNHHFIPMEDLTKEAQKRAIEIKLHVDDLFSLRLDAKKRLFGIIEKGTFHIIWYDENHEICPSNKKHT